MTQAFLGNILALTDWSLPGKSCMFSSVMLNCSALHWTWCLSLSLTLTGVRKLTVRRCNSTVTPINQLSFAISQTSTSLLSIVFHWAKSCASLYSLFVMFLLLDLQCLLFSFFCTPFFTLLLIGYLTLSSPVSVFIYSYLPFSLCSLSLSH